MDSRVVAHIHQMFTHEAMLQCFIAEAILPSQGASTFGRQGWIMAVTEVQPLKRRPRPANAEEARAKPETEMLIENLLLSSHPRPFPLYGRISIRQLTAYDSTALSRDAGNVAEIQYHLSKASPLIFRCDLQRKVKERVDLHGYRLGLTSDYTDM
jgi:hypothetical protein